MLILALVWPILMAFDDPDPADVSNPPLSQAEAAPTKLIQGVADSVLANHIDPPTRQQLILMGIKAVSEAAGVPAPAGLSRRVSTLVSPAQFAALVEETWPRAPLKEDVEHKETPARALLERGLGWGSATAMTPGQRHEMLTRAFIDGMLQADPGVASLVSSKEAKVREQLRGNLYVGIHILLGRDNGDERPMIVRALPGGPAHRAGVLDHDVIERIDGKDTLKMAVTEAVDRLRGEEGTAVEIEVRQPKSKDVRRLKITRGRLPQPTIKGIRERASGGWDVRIEDASPVAYLKIESMTGSTPHELRQMARQLESEGFRALMLDLRGIRETSLHAAVLLADELLDGGTIGRVRTADRVTVYQAQPDSLFRGWPLAVLIDGATRGPAEWLAAALQDNHRAILVGSPTPGDAIVRTLVPVAGGDWAIELPTRILERADGRPIGLQSAATEPNRLAVRGFSTARIHRGGVNPDRVPTSEVKVVPGRPGIRPAPVTDAKSEPLLDRTRRDALRWLGESLKSSGVERQ